MNDQRAFFSLHPLTTLVIIVVAMVLGMLVRQPSYLACGLICSTVSLVALCGRACSKLLVAIALLCVLVVLLNPLFTTYGDTVLFTIFGGRPYTFEALCFGITTASSLAMIVLWCSIWNTVISSDKLVYMLTPFAPVFALVLSMTLRLVPIYERRIYILCTAWAGLGRSFTKGHLVQRIRYASLIVSQLVTWAFESGLTTADTMRSRGFATTARTRYATYRVRRRDVVLLLSVTVCIVLIAAGFVVGIHSVSYYPQLMVPSNGVFGFAGLAAYALLLLMPALVMAKEACVWCISLSKI